jgi:hypothetical protein
MCNNTTISFGQILSIRTLKVKNAKKQKEIFNF